MKTDLEWAAECGYIELVTARGGKVPALNNDTATFIRYCTMQRDMATREGRHDSAQYIQHCLDDLGAPDHA